jgi:apolipoprotein N-acyltransferase
MKRNALICACVSLLMTLVLHFGEYQRMSAPQMVGALFAGTLALWAISGIALFCSKKENVLRNWLIALIALALITTYGEYSRPKEADFSGDWLTYRLTRKDGTVCEIKFKTIPNAQDLAEAQQYIDAGK